MLWVLLGIAVVVIVLLFVEQALARRKFNQIIELQMSFFKEQVERLEEELNRQQWRRC